MVNLLGILLFLAMVALLIFALVQTHQDLLTSIGWNNEVVSIGWVSSPG